MNHLAHVMVFLNTTRKLRRVLIPHHQRKDVSFTVAFWAVSCIRMFESEVSFSCEEKQILVYSFSLHKKFKMQVLMIISFNNSTAPYGMSL